MKSFIKKQKNGEAWRGVQSNQKLNFVELCIFVFFREIDHTIKSRHVKLLLSRVINTFFGD